MIRRHYYWIIAVLVAVVSVLLVFTLEELGTPYDTLEVQDVTSQEAFDLIQENHGNPDFIILDVRTSLEFHDGHIEGALNIDVNLPSFSEELEQLDRNATYLVYCRSGNRSRTALRKMDDLGFTRVYHLTNGITEWVDAGLPVIKS